MLLGSRRRSSGLRHSAAWRRPRVRSKACQSRSKSRAGARRGCGRRGVRERGARQQGPKVRDRAGRERPEGAAQNRRGSRITLGRHGPPVARSLHAVPRPPSPPQRETAAGGQETGCLLAVSRRQSNKITAVARWLCQCRHFSSRFRLGRRVGRRVRAGLIDFPAGRGRAGRCFSGARQRQAALPS